LRSPPGISLGIELLRIELDRSADETERIIRARRRQKSLAQNEILLSDLFESIARADAPQTRSVLLFVDRWEELYTQTDKSSHRTIFLDHLCEAFTTGPHRLIFTVRADFTSYLLEEHRRFFDAAKPGITPLPRMTRDELSDAIRKPSEVINIRFDDGLVEAFLGDAGNEPGSLSLVEFALTELWRSRDKAKNEITLGAYHALGGLNGAIDRHADAVYGRLSPNASGTMTNTRKRSSASVVCGRYTVIIVTSLHMGRVCHAGC
jgi:hypothetical protein